MLIVFKPNVFWSEAKKYEGAVCDSCSPTAGLETPRAASAIPARGIDHPRTRRLNFP